MKLARRRIRGTWPRRRVRSPERKPTAHTTRSTAVRVRATNSPCASSNCPAPTPPWRRAPLPTSRPRPNGPCIPWWQLRNCKLRVATRSAHGTKPWRITCNAGKRPSARAAHWESERDETNFSFPRSSVGMPSLTLQRHACTPVYSSPALARCRTPMIPLLLAGIAASSARERGNEGGNEIWERGIWEREDSPCSGERLRSRSCSGLRSRFLPGVTPTRLRGRRGPRCSPPNAR